MPSGLFLPSTPNEVETLLCNTAVSKFTHMPIYSRMFMQWLAQVFTSCHGHHQPTSVTSSASYTRQNSDTAVASA
jgi:hypothetical protein